MRVHTSEPSRRRAVRDHTWTLGLRLGEQRFCLVSAWSGARSPTSGLNAGDGTLCFPEEAFALDWLSRLDGDAIDRAALRRLLVQVCPLVSVASLSEQDALSLVARELWRGALVVRVERRAPLIGYPRREAEPESAGAPLLAAPTKKRGLAVQVLTQTTPKALSASIISTTTNKALSASITTTASMPDPVAPNPSGE